MTLTEQGWVLPELCLCGMAASISLDMFWGDSPSPSCLGGPQYSGLDIPAGSSHRAHSSLPAPGILFKIACPEVHGLQPWSFPAPSHSGTSISNAVTVLFAPECVGLS